MKIVLRACGHESYLIPLINKYGIGEIVHLKPPISYDEALVEMLEADGLLIMQSSNCNNQIPAKLYEYLRAQKPIFAMTDPNGDTAALLALAGVTSIAKLNSVDNISQELKKFLNAISNGNVSVTPMETVQYYSRESGTRKLAAMLNAALAKID